MSKKFEIIKDDISCKCQFCGKENKEKLQFNYLHRNGQIINICKECREELKHFITVH